MPSTAAALADVEQVRADVDAVLAGHLTALATELGGLGADGADLVEAVRDMLGGGKRLRAAFCYWSWRAHGGATEGRHADRSQVLAVGAALELFQAAALFHDDVMDDSDTRRGRPAAHRRFADLHLDQGWSGPARRFGDSAAILLGDLALIASERQFTDAVQHLSRGPRDTARRVFDQMRTEVIVGQYLDVLAQARPWGQDPAGDELGARAVIRAKSARYSVEHPLSLGAALAGADDEALARCQEVGLPLGEAFQLRDDLLGVFGDPSTTGKPAGDDLREGKRTVLIARAMATADPADRQLITDRLGRRGLTDAAVDEVRGALRRSGAADAVEALIGELAGPALAALAASPLAEPGRSMLVDLGHAAVDRHA